MAQAALQEELIPAGGIADFVMSDAEIAALESEETEKQFGTGGIARFEPIAKRMASYGRYGDDQVVHAETGELLVPRALIEGNPELKESIFSHLRDMGVEDPERYVVGSGANSINPETGMPEFFFKSIRRAVSKVAKGVSKAVSKVGKVLKKVAPVVLTIAGTAAFGPMYGAALGSGIGTLIQGGNLKDALKASLKAGAMGGISAGLASKFSGGTFMEGVRNASDLGNVSAGFESVGKAATGDFSGFSMSNMSQGPTAKGGTAYQAPSAEATVTETLAGATDVTPAQEVAAATDITGPSMDPTVARVNDPFFQDAAGNFDPNKYYNYVTEAGRTQTLGIGPDGSYTVLSDVPNPVTSGIDLDAANVQQNLLGTTSTGVTQVPSTTETSFFDTLGEYGTKAKNLYGEYISPSRGMPTAADIAGKTKELMAINPSLGSAEATALATKELTPNLIARYAPIGAIGAAGAAAGGFFDAAPQEDPNLVDRRTGTDLLAENAEAYMVGGRDPRYATGPNVVGTQYGYQIPNYMLFNQNPFMRPQAPQMRAADGGEVYPRRNGGIMPNEGIPDQDSVRALLMPGEFVMTKDAVRGLGNGNLNQGINNMYSMMRNLEAKGQVA